VNYNRRTNRNITGYATAPGTYFHNNKTELRIDELNRINYILKNERYAKYHNFLNSILLFYSKHKFVTSKQVIAVRKICKY